MNMTQETLWQRAQREATELAFITRAFAWFILLLSRLAEPLMFVATMYIIAQTVQPQIFSAPFFAAIERASVIALNLAPEIIMPGCFLRARSAGGEGWKFKGLGFLFLVLTLVTLISFVYKASADVVLFILLIRCAAGVLYALVSMMSTPVAETTTPAPKMWTALQEELDAQRERVEAQNASHTTALATLDAAHTARLDATIADITASHEARTRALVCDLLAQVEERHTDKLEAMKQTVTRIAIEEIRTTVEQIRPAAPVVEAHVEAKRLAAPTGTRALTAPLPRQVKQEKGDTRERIRAAWLADTTLSPRKIASLVDVSHTTVARHLESIKTDVASNDDNRESEQQPS